MDYIAVHITLTPFSEEFAEIIEAGVEDLGFDSFTIEEPCLNAFIPKEHFDSQALKTVLSGYVGEGFELSVSTELIPEQNWNAVWESDFEPVVVAGTVTVKAPYHKDLPRTKYNIIIDPQMSFGSGHHQTTCMMIEALLREGRGLRGKSVLDMGCGTGILAIVAAKLGAQVPVHAIDIDPVCIRSAAANAKRNRVGHKITSRCGDASYIQKGRYDIILANINRNILLADMPTYVRALKPEGGTLMLSGFFEEDVPCLLEKAESLGLKMQLHLEHEGWSMVSFSSATSFCR
ncbi:MAG: 50S ribosomal protein L11 methyltransferase [Bacteroidales bacterium]|nr:50S ribosomal protein L11 methyltransferase [Bacteroidales bacterium]